jgi:Rps23 Pro-64 3,4-dihydroxylase Tpa1-like proline 4-hydroxylase
VGIIKASTAGHQQVFFFEKDQPYEQARTLSAQYNSAQPFPHIVIDDFLSVDLAEEIIASFPAKEECSVLRTHAYAYLKRGYKPDDLATNVCRNYLYLFNTSPLLQWLEHLTGIPGLIPDPYFTGGGFHEIDRGGRLGVHTDFNLYSRLNLIRRINLLVYLNKDWRPEYGGNLELWNADVTACVRSIEPLFNRCVIFNTDKRSFHGHPEPLNCPDTRTRRSIAIYYYSAPTTTIVATGDVNERTDYRARPGTSDGPVPF